MSILAVGARRVLRLRGASLSLLLLLLLVLVGGAAVAAPENPKRAKELFQEGTTFFDIGQFDKAIEAWQAGYKEKPDPGFLFNIAQAYRLAGNPNKAIFFYRGYLRNSPRAPNRDEVESKIEALQKQLSEIEAGRPGQPPVAPPSAALTPGGPPPPASAPMARAEAPVPDGAPPTVPEGAGTVPMTFDAPPVAPVENVERQADPPHPAMNQKYDLGAAIGANGWNGGLREDPGPTFAFAMTGGYLFGTGERRWQFRLGGVIGFTALSEKRAAGTSQPTNVVSLWSWLVEPSVRYRLSARWYLSGGLGLGAMTLSGLTQTSPLLAQPAPAGGWNIEGVQGFFLFRPALGAEYRISGGLGVQLTLASPSSEEKKNYHAPIRRSELLVGLTYHR